MRNSTSRRYLQHSLGDIFILPHYRMDSSINRLSVNANAVGMQMLATRIRMLNVKQKQKNNNDAAEETTSGHQEPEISASFAVSTMHKPKGHQLKAITSAHILHLITSIKHTTWSHHIPNFVSKIIEN